MCESVVQDDDLFPFLEVWSRRLSAKLPAPVSSARVGTEQATAVVAANGTHIATSPAGSPENRHRYPLPDVYFCACFLLNPDNSMLADSSELV